MAASEIHVFDAGTRFEVQLRQEDNSVYSVEDADVMKFLFQKPDGDLLERSGHFVTNGADGKVQYITDDSDLDQPGLWRYQVYIEKGPVEKHTDVGSFRVYPNLPLE